MQRRLVVVEHERAVGGERELGQRAGEAAARGHERSISVRGDMSRRFSVRLQKSRTSRASQPSR